MAGFTLGALFDAIGNQLRERLEGREVTVDPYNESSDVPRIVLDLDENDPIDLWVTGTSAGYGAVRVVLRIIPGGVDGSSRIRLFALLSAGTGNESSVWDALYADKTFGGAAEAFELGTPTYDSVGVEFEIPLTVYLKKVGASA